MKSKNSLLEVGLGLPSNSYSERSVTPIFSPLRRPSFHRPFLGEMFEVESERLGLSESKIEVYLNGM